MLFNLNKKSIVFLALVLVLASYFSKPVKNTIAFVVSPVQGFFGSCEANISASVNYLFKAGSFQKENENLKLKILELEQKISEQKSIEQENKDLKDVVGSGLEKKFSLITAKTIVKKATEDIILIDKGEKQGVLQDMVAVTAQKVLVGRVFSVFPDYSEVMLLSHPSMVLFNVKAPLKGIEAMARGRGNGLLTLEFAPNDKALEKGDVLVSSLTGGIFPENFLIGHISKCKKDDTDPIPYAEIDTAYKFSVSDSIFLIAPK